MMTEDPRAAEEAARFRATLSELNANNKIHITALTMLAEENKEFAVHIVTCIEDQLRSVPNKQKLPILYLIDSICKNYPNSIYVQLFTQNLVSNFCHVFDVSDERVRKSLHKLKCTWNATKTFPESKLNAIDERVHEKDPNWPIAHRILAISSRTQPPPQNQQQQQPQLQQQQSHSQPVTNNLNLPAGAGQDSNRRNNQGRANTKRKRIKLGQLRNNPQIEPQPPVLPVLPPSQTFIDPNIIQASQLHPIPFLDPSITIAANDHIHQVPAATYLDPNLIIASNEPQLSNPQLFCTPQTQTLIQPNTQEPPPAHLAVLESLYGGKQCSNCSLRFDDNNRYDNHLDWHFRQNSKSDNMFARKLRKWYYPLNLWVQFREINDELQEDNNNDNDVAHSLVSDNDEIPTAPASKQDENNICSVCHETFEKFWAEEEEEWRLKNAKLYQDERVYHPLCLVDMLQASVAEVEAH